MLAVRTVLITACFLAISAPVAMAGPPSRKPAAEDRIRKRAEAHFQKGRELFAFGAYDDAIREYEAAYALLPLPDLLFNIGQVYRTQGRREQAIAYYRRYLDAAPQGDAAGIARSHIEALEAEIRAEREAAERRREAEEQAVRDRPAADAKQRRDAEAAAKAAARRAAELESSRRVAEAEARQRRGTGRTLRMTGAGIAGLGVAALGAGLIFGLRARSLSREASSATGSWTDELGQKVDDAEAAERTMFVLTTAGGVTLLGGSVLYYLGRRMGKARAPEVKPLATNRAAGVILGWRF